MRFSGYTKNSVGDGVVLWADENVELCEKAQPTRRATPMLTLGDSGEV
jgi:hypothetical protein